MMLKTCFCTAIAIVMLGVASIASVPAHAKDGRNLTVQQMEQKSSRQQAEK